MPIFASNMWNRVKQMLFLISLSGLANSAFANVCKDAIEEHCLDVRSEGGEAVIACMESHKDDLSSECAEQVDKMLAQRDKSGSKGGVCKDAIEEHCSDVRSEGSEAVMACMESHKDDLSSECAEQVDKMLAQ
jgi:phosphoribosyl-ATP pyrophosphohydrolase